MKKTKLKTKEKIKQGWSIHCHHDTLIEYCYNYAERVKYIKSDKPQNEQKVRLRVFKMLPNGAEKDIPEKLLKAYQAWKQAYQAWEQADQALKQAYQAWKQADRDAFHKKWCVPNCPWNGKELVFRREKDE